MLRRILQGSIGLVRGSDSIAEACFIVIYDVLLSLNALDVVKRICAAIPFARHNPLAALFTAIIKMSCCGPPGFPLLKGQLKGDATPFSGCAVCMPALARRLAGERIKQRCIELGGAF